MTHGAAAAHPSLVFAFAAGTASFLSPCVLPVLPAFIAHLGGTTLDEDTVSRRKVFLSTVLFVLGFSMVFGVLGVLLQGVFRDASAEILTWISRVAGVIIIAFGVHLAGLVTFEGLESERGLTRLIDRMEPGYATSLLFGGAFAVAWTPCVGPLLGSVLGLAASEPASAFPLLVTYAGGIGAPFLLVGLFPTRLTQAARGRGVALQRIQRFFGYVIVALGVLVFTNQLSRVANFEFVVGLLS